MPSQRTLRDYRNFFKPDPGFNSKNIERLKEQSSDYFDIQRYVVLSFDEMKIQSKLVFDKRSNELIGFVDLGEEQLNEAMTSPNELATHALAFLVRGVATDLKYTLAYFLTKDVTSHQLKSLFWKAVCVLELACNMWICAAVSDGPHLIVDAMNSMLILAMSQTKESLTRLPIFSAPVEKSTFFLMPHTW